MVQPMLPQPITDMGYGGMDFLRKFQERLKQNKVPVAQEDNEFGDIAMAGYSPLIPEGLRDKYKREADIDKYLKNLERLRKRGLV